MTDAERRRVVLEDEELYLLYRRSAPANSGFKKWVAENAELIDHLIAVKRGEVES